MSRNEFEDVEKQNLISIFIALGYTADSLKPFLDDKFKTFHDDLKQQVTSGIQGHVCNKQPPCSSSSNLQKWCGVCSGWWAVILNAHSYRRGSLKIPTVNSARWPYDYKEVEKCYNPEWCNRLPSGSPNVDDISVLIGRMINCNDIRQQFVNTVDPTEIKDIRNNISHNVEITADEKSKYFEVIMNFLQTPCLWSLQCVREVYVKIKSLKDINYIDMIKNRTIEEHEIARLKLMEEEAGDFWRREPLLLMEKVTEKELSEDDNPTIVTREEWHARACKASQEMETPVKVVFVHHTAGIHGYTQKQCSHIVRNLQSFQMDGNNWDDIAYNFIIGEDGRVYEGRGWNKVGAHTLGWNNKSVSFAFLGNFSDKQPNAASLKALKNVISYGVQNKKICEDYTLFGHRDKRPTESPGNYLYAEIKHFDHFHLNKTN